MAQLTFTNFCNSMQQRFPTPAPPPPPAPAPIPPTPPPPTPHPCNHEECLKVEGFKMISLAKGFANLDRHKARIYLAQWVRYADPIEQRPSSRRGDPSARKTRKTR